MRITIRWSLKAIKQFTEAIEYIEKDSLANAEKVKRGILEKIDELILYPQKHKPDKYKINNDGSFHAFELHRYRISYRNKPSQIRIIRIRHTKMNPQKY